MNGQAKILILALTGFVILLLAGITGIDMPRVRQATAIAETRAVTVEEYRYQRLGKAFRADADAAAREMSQGIAENLAVRLKHPPSVVVAQNAAHKRERS